MAAKVHLIARVPLEEYINTFLQAEEELTKASDRIMIIGSPTQGSSCVVKCSKMSYKVSSTPFKDDPLSSQLYEVTFLINPSVRLLYAYVNGHGSVIIETQTQEEIARQKEAASVANYIPRADGKHSGSPLFDKTWIINRFHHLLRTCFWEGAALHFQAYVDSHP